MKHDKNNCVFKVFDTCGLESVSQELFVQNVDVVVFVFDLSEIKSLQDVVKHWLPLVQKSERKNPALFLFAVWNQIGHN